MIVNQLSTETNKIIQSAEFTDFLRKQGSGPTIMTPEELGTFIKAEIAKWAIVVKAAGITAE